MIFLFNLSMAGYTATRDTLFKRYSTTCSESNTSKLRFPALSNESIGADRQRERGLCGLEQIDREGLFDQEIALFCHSGPHTSYHSVFYNGKISLGLFKVPNHILCYGPVYHKCDYSTGCDSVFIYAHERTV